MTEGNAGGRNRQKKKKCLKNGTEGGVFSQLPATEVEGLSMTGLRRMSVPEKALVD